MRLYVPLKVVGVGHALVHHTSPPRIASRSPVNPEFQSVVPASALQRIAAEVVQFCVGMEQIMRHVRVVAKPAKNIRFLHQKRTAYQGHAHHFVCVPANAVGFLNTVHQSTVLV